MPARTNLTPAEHDPDKPRWRGVCDLCAFTITSRTRRALAEAQVDHEAYDREFRSQITQALRGLAMRTRSS